MKPKKGRNKKTISDKICEALTVQPRVDLEEDTVFRTKPHILRREELSSEDEETNISEFRRQNIQLLSDLGDKYKGEVISKRELSLQNDTDTSNDGENVVSSSTDILPPAPDSDENESDTDTEVSNRDSKLSDSNDEQSDSDAESEDYSIEQPKKLKSDSEGSDENKNGEESDASEEGGFDISEMDAPPKEMFEHMKKQNMSEEVKKGQCVRNELLIWEGLLEMRIHLQRCLNTANQMPFPDTYKELVRMGGKEFNRQTNNTKIKVSRILDKLLTLQMILLKNFPETKSISTTQVSQAAKSEVKSDEEIASDDEVIPSDEEIPSDTEDEKSSQEEEKSQDEPPVKRCKRDYEGELSNIHKSFETFRNATIQKWNDKTRVAAVASKNAPVNSVLSQIDYILSDREKLVRRTQLKRSEYDIVGYKMQEREENTEDVRTRDRKEDDEYISEIYDDSDFYHQMLRELIECKSADITDPVQLSRQWIALQQMRSKMKRKVDTKATKGRRIKYVVHNKLVNFMAPEDSCTWTEEMRNELYSSLFGKLFENSDVVSKSSFSIG